MNILASRIICRFNLPYSKNSNGNLLEQPRHMLRVQMIQVLIIALASLILANSLAFAGPAFEPGEWQMTSRMVMPGIQMQMPAQTFTMCLTKENMTPNNPQHQHDCKITKRNISGNTVTWTMVCKNGGKTTTMQGKAIYKGDSMESTMIIHGQGIQMTNHTTGKRLGPCRK